MRYRFVHLKVLGVPFLPQIRPPSGHSQCQGRSFELLWLGRSNSVWNLESRYFLGQKLCHLHNTWVFSQRNAFHRIYIYIYIHIYIYIYIFGWGIGRLLMLHFRISGQVSFLSNHRTITAKCPNKSGSGIIALCPEESIHIAIHTAKLWKKQISLLRDRSPFFIVFKGAFVCLTLYRLLVVCL